MYTKASIDTTATQMGIDPASLTTEQRCTVCGLMLQAYETSLVAGQNALLAAEQGSIASILGATQSIEKTVASFAPPATPAP
jgi:hypothetical protein